MTKDAELLAEGDVVEGLKGWVKIVGTEARQRADRIPLIIIRAEGGEVMRFEPTHPVQVFS